MTDHEYAGEVIRIIEILAKVVPEPRAVSIASQLEASAKEADVLVAYLLSRPEIMARYDVDSYDGIELRPKPPAVLPIHFIRSGSWSIKSLNVSNLLCFEFTYNETYRTRGILGWFRSFFHDNNNYHSDYLLEWFRKDLEFTKLRLDELDRNSTISVLDKKKARIVVLNESIVKLS